MNRQEQEIVEKLKAQTDQIKVPERLAPEQIEQLLEEKGKKSCKDKSKRLYRIGGLAAACIALVAGMAVYMGGRDGAGLGRDSAAPQAKTENMEASDEKRIASAADYGEVYDYLDAYRQEMEREQSRARADIALYEKKVTEESAADSAVGGAMQDTGSASGSSAALLAEGEAAEYAEEYSETNVRQKGVDEGDVVKTDGTYLYVLKDNRSEVSIVDTRGGVLKEVETISVGGEEWIEEIYLDVQGKNLVLVCSKYEDEGAGISPQYARGGYWYAGSTEAVSYDVSDPENVAETGRVAQSGTYSSSRMADGYLYLFSNYSIPWDLMGNMERDKPETYVPLVNGEAVLEKDICMPLIPAGREYTVVASVDMEQPDRAADSKAILSQGGTLYVSNENVYYYETRWSSGFSGSLVKDTEQTTIRRISYKDGKLDPQSQGKISGYIHDSFSIDEYNGYLRAVTTEGESNAVYVLDMDLETVGAIKGLAKEERVYSARLMGDTGYFVTFKETDPLFSVDFSDPENPEIIGELKIPGFSDYLHPYGAGKLLGVGMNVDEETMVTDGVKLTMFDVSDPSDVKEENTYILKNVYGTDISYDYKAALVDAERNITGFAGYTEGGQHYFVFEYDEINGFSCKMEEEINGNASSSVRGVYIGDTLYVVQGNVIEAYSLKEFRKVDDIIL